MTFYLTAERGHNSGSYGALFQALWIHWLSAGCCIPRICCRWKLVWSFNCDPKRVLQLDSNLLVSRVPGKPSIRHTLTKDILLVATPQFWVSSRSRDP